MTLTDDVPVANLGVVAALVLVVAAVDLLVLVDPFRTS